MKTSTINLVYFSATYTTRKIVRLIAGQIGHDIRNYDITQSPPEEDIITNEQSVLIVGMPVYVGRIPAGAVEALNKFKGNGNPAVIVCVYGNRDYDDALLELKEVVETNGFKVISAAAFIAQHSIFPQVGTNRPDEKDINLIKEFANKSTSMLHSLTNINSFSEISISGNHPYKIPGKIPLRPKGNKKCNDCGTCVRLCPPQAILVDNPRKTIKEKCIACGRCIVVCPQEARSFSGLLYRFAGKRFLKANIARKEPETMFAKPV